MDEQVKQHLISYLDKLETAIQKGADIAAEQLPLALQEYVAYCRIASTLDLVVCGLLALFGFWCMWYTNHAADRAARKTDSDTLAFCFVAGFLITFGGGLAFLANAKHCIKSWVAPRVVLLEKVNELRK